jgi:DNA-binding HxlR family transcriptional regulator
MDDFPTPRVCSVARTLEVIGEKWSLLALREVFFGVRRFDAIQRNTGAPRDILTVRLRKLVAEGLLERRQYQQRPARFEYHLTPAGQDLQSVLLTLMQWGDRYLAGGTPPATFQHRCGARLEPVVTCRACGEPVRNREVRVAVGAGPTDRAEGGQGRGAVTATAARPVA